MDAVGQHYWASTGWRFVTLTNKAVVVCLCNLKCALAMLTYF